MPGPVSSAIGALDKSVETISDRAFEAVQRYEVRRGPTPQQKLLKKVQARTASQADTQEAIGFGLVEEDEVTLTPLGEYLLSGYPEEAEPSGQETAAEGSPETAAQ